jgi:translation initiation factor IF-3
MIVSIINYMDKKRSNFKKEREHKLNSEVRFDKVRIISEGFNGLIISSREAMDLAISKGLDLILINDKIDIPLVRIEDYGKFLYDKKKNIKKPKVIEVKEIKLSLNISEHDLKIKAKKAEEFLGKSNKVKVTLMLKGRERSMSANGQIVMLRFAEILSEFGVPENMPKNDSNKWIMTIKPKK